MSNPERPTQIPRRTGGSSTTRSQTSEPTGNGAGGATGTETEPGGPQATGPQATRTARAPNAGQPAGTGGTTTGTGATRTPAATGAAATRTAAGAGATRTAPGATPGLTRTVTTTAAGGGPQNAGTTPAASQGRRSSLRGSPELSDDEDLYQNPPETFEHAPPGRVDSISRHLSEESRRSARQDRGDRPPTETAPTGAGAAAPRQGRAEPSNREPPPDAFENVAREVFKRVFDELKIANQRADKLTANARVGQQEADRRFTRLEGLLENLIRRTDAMKMAQDANQARNGQGPSRPSGGNPTEGRTSGRRPDTPYPDSDDADPDRAFRQSGSDEEPALAGMGADAPGDEPDAAGGRVRVRQGPTEAERLRAGGFNPDGSPAGLIPSISQRAPPPNTRFAPHNVSRGRGGMRRTVAPHGHGGGDSSDGSSDHDGGPGRPVSGVNPRFLREGAARGGGPPGPVPVPNDGYEDSSLQWIHDCIVEYLGAELDVLPQLKNVKVAQPSAYNGQDNTDEFEEWFMALLRWLRVNRISGPALDGERVHLLGIVLSDAAIE
ncbi:hypothetical protein EIP86_009310, partial [Pleurotus ostreatoroseus]